MDFCRASLRLDFDLGLWLESAEEHSQTPSPTCLAGCWPLPSALQPTVCSVIHILPMDSFLSLST